MVLVGNKADLEEQRQVTFDEGAKHAAELGMWAFLGTSEMEMRPFGGCVWV